MTGPNPTDRGKLGSKIHLICDRNGLPLSLGISGANMYDSQGLEPLVRGIPRIRFRRGPRRRKPAKLHGGKGYDYDHLRRWLRERGIRYRIARKGIESSKRLGRHRWVVERTVSWLASCRRLHRRYERKAEHFLAFVGIAAVLISHRRLQTVSPSSTKLHLACDQAGRAVLRDGGRQMRALAISSANERRCHVSVTSVQLRRTALFSALGISRL